MNLPIVGVVASGTESNEPEHGRKAQEIGEWLASEGVHLLTGGGGGLMMAVSRAFYEQPNRRGLVIGVLPCVKDDPKTPKKNYPNRWVEIPIYTHLPLSGPEGGELLSRNHINVLTSQVIIALAGGEGTLSEVKLAVTYKRPVVAYVDSPADIPGLPNGIPIYQQIGAVQRFVRVKLTSRPGST